MVRTGLWDDYYPSPPFSMHDHAGWAVLAEPGRPLYLRVFAHAYCSHRQNGHATFDAPGSLRKALSYVNTVTDELHVPSRQAVTQAIEKAVDYGYLHELSLTSAQRCLVVPPFVHGGIVGRPSARCVWHRDTS